MKLNLFDKIILFFKGSYLLAQIFSSILSKFYVKLVWI